MCAKADKANFFFVQGVLYGVCHSQVPSRHREVQVDPGWGVSPGGCVWGPGFQLSSSSDPGGMQK